MRMEAKPGRGRGDLPREGCERVFGERRHPRRQPARSARPSRRPAGKRGRRRRRSPTPPGPEWAWPRGGRAPIGPRVPFIPSTAERPARGRTRTRAPGSAAGPAEAPFASPGIPIHPHPSPPFAPAPCRLETGTLRGPEASGPGREEGRFRFQVPGKTRVRGRACGLFVTILSFLPFPAPAPPSSIPSACSLPQIEPSGACNPKAKHWSLLLSASNPRSPARIAQK